MKPRFTDSQKGQALFLMIFMTLGLLLLSGLSIDSAHAFLKHAKLRRAVDAAAIAGIARLNSGADVETAKADAVAMARYNLRQMGIPDNVVTELSANATIDASRVMTMNVVARMDLETFFMGLIPGLRNVPVSAASTARRNPAVLSLVLDISGSMSGGKFDDMKEAAKGFVNSFQENVDQIAIVAYSENAYIKRPMGTFSAHEELTSVIDDLATESATNIALGVQYGREEIERVKPTKDTVKAILLFTDGAPNTIQARYLDRNDAPPTGQPLPQNPGGSGEYYYRMRFFQQLRHPVTNEQVPCSSGSYNDPFDCLSSYRYLDSRGNVRGANAGLNNGNYEAYKEHYNLPIVEGDYAKDEGITIYSVGLGDPAPEGASAYQDVYDHYRLKSYLLRRMANATLPSDPEFDDVSDDTDKHPTGLYLQTPDSTQLKNLFMTVVRKIQLRLVD